MKTLAHALFYGVPLIFSCCVFGLVYWLQTSLHINVTDFFDKNLRASLFAGFLTMGGFLLSLKTGIVIKIKESVYDNEAYLRQVAKRATIDSSITRYGPLKRLSRVLSVSVLFCLVASISQFTLGLASTWWSTASCLAIATFAMGLLIASFILIQVNLSQWFDFLEDNPK